jgi:hypothetical protein
VQEEFRRNTRDGYSSKRDDEEDCALTAKARKGKGNKSQSNSESKVKKLDLSKVKCFHCHERGNLATNCPQKKKNKTIAGAAIGEALVSQFELDFALIACMESSASGLVWYLDSGTSFHMMGDKESFIDLEEKDLRMHIEMGDDGRYSATGIGTITFQREIDLHAEDELLVPKDESQDVDQPHEEVHGVEETTQVEPSIRNG